MPLFQIDVEKRLGSEFWSNVYWGNGVPDLGNAEALANQIVSAERLAHSTLVQFTRLRVSDPNSEAYSITTLGVTGSRGFTNILPLFNTLRVDLNASVGRPSRKYYRGCLDEGDIAGDAVTAAFDSLLTALEALFATSAEGPGLVDPQGQLFVGAVQHPFVQMRQLRRGTRRRGTPIFQ